MGSYQVEIARSARDEIRRLPGNMRQRMIRLLREFEQSPRPPNSTALNRAKLELPDDLAVEPRRLRLESWRIVYVVDDEAQSVLVLAVRKRPPYQYEDLNDLLRQLE